MRPVDHVATGPKLSDYRKAKPQLIAAMGEFCAYCERHMEAINLDVEHIEPQKTHPNLKLTWSNYLLACKTCNTYKRHYQEANVPNAILSNQAWPHLDNTFSAYEYDQHGLVKLAQTLTANNHATMAQRTLEMVGLDKTPANAATYRKLGLIYDITSRREKAWSKAKIALVAYLQNPTDAQCESILNQSEEVGFFSIWMAVFVAYPKLKNGLIARFKAAPACFDVHGNTISQRAPGRI